MIIAISQPTVFPWIGYFDIIKKCDVFVFLDDVQIQKRGWQTRNKIKNPNTNSSEIWLNIPIKKTGLETKINEAQIDNSQDWKNKHIKTLDACYGKNFRDSHWIQEHYKKHWDYLVDFNITFIKNCCQYLDIKTNFKISSELNVSGKRTEKLVNICKKLNADCYLSTIGSKVYLENEKYFFEKNNIKIIYHDYTHPLYSQRGETFVPYLSILDLILNNEVDSKKI